MAVDPYFQALLDAMRQAGFPPIGSVSAVEMRAAGKLAPPPEPPVKEVRDFIIPDESASSPARLYRPAAKTGGVIVYYHGGGWTIGDLDAPDSMLRIIANAANVTIISVDYRLAPEHVFPAAVNDAFVAVKWASDERAALTGAVDAPLMVMGDSAGGNLSAVVSQLARDAGGPAIALQILLYPSTECDVDGADLNAPPPPFLSVDEIGWFCDQYIPKAKRSDPRFAPAKATDLSNLPPAIIVPAENDLLAAEARRYAQLLNDAGNDATIVEGTGAIHGFLTMAPASPLGAQVIDEIVAGIDRVTGRVAAPAT